jgi:hypothetical protein
MRTLLLASVSDSPVACLYCFGLGRLASPVTRHQAALLLLLKENFQICFSFFLVPVQLWPLFSAHQDWYSMGLDFIGVPLIYYLEKIILQKRQRRKQEHPAVFKFY